MSDRVVVLGASSKPERYSNKAMQTLVEQGYDAVPVHPRESEVCGTPVVADLADVPSPVHTITVYVRPDIFREMLDALIALQPARVILNPGTEDVHAATRLRESGVEVVEACTLVMLRTGQF